MKNGFKVLKKKIRLSSSKKIFVGLKKTIEFVENKKFNFKSWNDISLHNYLIRLRLKNKEKFSMIYGLMQQNSVLNEFCIENNFIGLSNNFLKNKEKNLTLRFQFRMDPPTDRNNLYGWHQDSAYDNFNSKPSNGVILWVPLLDAHINAGALEVKPGSQIEKNRFFVKNKMKKYLSPQLNVPKKYLKKYPTKIIPISKNSCLCMYANVFHKSGINQSKKVRFTIIARLNKLNSKDFYLYQKIKPYKNLH